MKMKNRAEWVGKHISKTEKILDIGIKDAYVFHTLGFYPDVAVDIHPEDVPKEVKNMLISTRLAFTIFHFQTIPFRW